MDPDAKITLKRILELTEENNRMLRSARRAAWWSGFFKVIWWVVILGLPFALYYYYLQPYMNELLGTYQNVKGAADKVQGVALDVSKLPQELRDFLSKFGLSGQ